MIPRVSICLSCEEQLIAYCVCSPTKTTTDRSYAVCLGCILFGYQLALGKSPCHKAWPYVMDRKLGTDCRICSVAISLANDWPSKQSLAVVCAATCSAYPLNQQLLQHIFGYFSSFVHTHDGYLRYISRIMHTCVITKIISTCANNVYQALFLHAPSPTIQVREPGD